MEAQQTESLFLGECDVGVATDLYQLTMAAGYFENRMFDPATFELFVRVLPPRRSYLVAAGVEQALDYLQNVSFSAEAIAYLRQHPSFKHVGGGFFDYLASFRFTGAVHAVPEGTLVFAEEPILRVTAPLIEAQIVETYLLSAVNFQTMVATKASRVVDAAKGRAVVDFGTRRAHGPAAGVLAARASFVGGCVGTSNVFAGMRLDIPVVGTAAHSWTMAFGDEAEAFRRYHDVFPDSTILLIDTYDTIEGARKAAAIGSDLKGVRLDSGDLVRLSKRVRKVLDEAGLKHVKIVASGDLNEYRIERLIRAGAPIDMFGVGTEMVTSRDAPALGGVYKLVECRRGRHVEPKVKRSTGKATYPGKKQVFRRVSARGRYTRDTLGLVNERLSGQPLLKPFMRRGRLCRRLPDMQTIQRHATAELARLPLRYKRPRNPDTYPVRKSARLERLRVTAEREILARGSDDSQ